MSHHLSIRQNSEQGRGLVLTLRLSEVPMVTWQPCGPSEDWTSGFAAAGEMSCFKSPYSILFIFFTLFHVQDLKSLEVWGIQNITRHPNDPNDGNAWPSAEPCWARSGFAWWRSLNPRNPWHSSPTWLGWWSTFPGPLVARPEVKKASKRDIWNSYTFIYICILYCISISWAGNCNSQHMTHMNSYDANI